jgi:hemoglobin
MTAPNSDPPDIVEADLGPVLDTFYARLGEDDLLRPYFVHLDMGAHIPRIEAFWATIVFGNRRYVGNAFAPHERMPDLTAEHFERWIMTLESVLDARFRGPAAERMKAAAHRIAYSMQLRLRMVPFEPYR